jgi:ABC-2 type transport system permease protein
MQVFKAYFKIIRKRLPSILIYFVIFVGVSMIITSMVGNRGAAAFVQTKTKIAFFNEDGASPLASGLKDYLAANAAFADIGDDRQSIQDALFNGNIEYALRVPAGFTQGFLSDTGGAKLQKTAASGSTGSVTIDLLIDRYLGIAQLYSRNEPGISAGQIAANVQKDLANQSVAVMKANGNAPDTNYLTYYFSYLAYAILGVMIMGVTSFMMAFNDTDLANRNQCSPVKPLNMNLQVLLGNATFAAAVWAVMCAMVFLIYGKLPLNAGTALLCLNALVITAVALSIGFLAGKFIRNPGVQSAVTNVVSLGISFISGVFVPQELLGSAVLGIARFTPTYWYVKTVGDIRDMTTFNFQSMLPALYGMLIQLGFAAAIFTVALMLAKHIRLSREI